MNKKVALLLLAAFFGVIGIAPAQEEVPTLPLPTFRIEPPADGAVVEV